MDNLYFVEEITNELLVPTFSDVDEFGFEFHRTPSKWDLFNQGFTEDDDKKDEEIEGDQSFGFEFHRTPSTPLLDKQVSEGDNGTTDPAEAKRARRKLANRESARRARRKKEAHLTELETKVAQLRLKKATLVRRLADMTQKYNKATVDNIVLTAEVKAQEAMVKMKEAEVFRVTGLHPTFLASPEISTIFNGGDILNQPLYPAAADNPIFHI